MNIFTKLLLDGFSSVISAMGSGTKDKSRSFVFVPRPRIDDLTLEYIYSQVPIARKIVNLLPFYMLKEGIDFTNKESVDFLNIYKGLKVFKHIYCGLINARLKGGAVNIILINDGLELDQPVNFNNIKSIDGIITLDKSFVTPYPYYVPNLETEVYQVTNTMQKIHCSRMLIWQGEESGQQIQATHNGWGESVLNGDLWESIENFIISHNCINPLLLEKSQGLFKIFGLNNLVSSKKFNQIQERMQITSMMMSITNKAVIDSQDDYLKVDTNLAHVKESIELTKARLVAETNYPHDLLLGESPGSSLGESGKSQKTNFYDLVKSSQTNILEPNLNKLNFILASFLKIENPTFIFNTLEQMTELENAEIKLKQAQTDTIYTEKIGIDNRDIVDSRFKDGKFSTNTVITRPIRIIYDPNTNVDKVA